MTAVVRSSQAQESSFDRDRDLSLWYIFFVVHFPQGCPSISEAGINNNDTQENREFLTQIFHA
jgi:hypothetical protein